MKGPCIVLFYLIYVRNRYMCLLLPHKNKMKQKHVICVPINPFKVAYLD